jgi:hypothetical protein
MVTTIFRFSARTNAHGKTGPALKPTWLGKTTPLMQNLFYRSPALCP